MCSCHSILECCVTFSGVKLSIRSFVLFKFGENQLNRFNLRYSAKAFRGPFSPIQNLFACNNDSNITLLMLNPILD